MVRREETGRPAVTTLPDEGARCEDLFSPALLAYALEHYRDAWNEMGPPSSEQESAALERFRHLVLELPEKIAGEEIQIRRECDHLRDVVRAGDGVELLKTGQFDLLRDRDDHRDFIERAVRRSVSGESKSLAGGLFSRGRDETGKKIELEDGTDIVFPAGIHDLNEARFREIREFPDDIRLVGSGMDTTLVRVEGINLAGDTRRLTIEHMTIDCRDNGLFDARTGGVVIALHGVRIVGFDSGHGGSFIVSCSKGSVIQAIGCEFIGGYGVDPGEGALYRLYNGAAALGYFRNCDFELLRLGFNSAPEGNNVVFEGCHFRSLLERMDLQTPGAEFLECRFGEEYDPNRPKDSYRKDLRELFPGVLLGR
ncbi:MAG: hypothetical protein RL885_32440 [Planctomycetota bacterium]